MRVSLSVATWCDASSAWAAAWAARVSSIAPPRAVGERDEREDPAGATGRLEAAYGLEVLRLLLVEPGQLGAGRGVPRLEVGEPLGLGEVGRGEGRRPSR